MLVLVLAVISPRKTPNLTGDLREYKETGHLDDAYNQLIWNIATDALTRPDEQATININGILDPAHVNFFILRDDPKKYFRQLTCNCAYAGRDNTVICDSSLLRRASGLLTMSSHSNNPQASTLPEENLRFGAALLKWVLGHEIGHMVLHHDRPLVGPTANAQVAQSPGQVEAIYNTQERQADLFLLTLLKSPQEKFWLWIALSSFAESFYLQQLNRARSSEGLPPVEMADLLARYPDAEQRLVTTAPSLSHPPTLVRVLDLGMRLLDNDKDIVDDSGYLPWLRSHLVIRTDPRSTDSFCTYNFTPTHDVASITTDRPASDTVAAGSALGRAELSFRMVQYETSRDLYTEAIKILLTTHERDPGVPRWLNSAYLQRSVINYLLMDYSAAVADLEIVRRDPQLRATATSNMGFALLEQGKWALAKDAFTQALAAEPKSADALGGFAASTFLAGDKGAARRLYETAVMLDSRYCSSDWLRYGALWQTTARGAAQAIKDHGLREGPCSGLSRK